MKQFGEPRETGSIVPRDFLFGDPGPDISRVAQAVAKAAGISIEDMRSRKMRREYVRPRHAAMYLAYTTLDKSTTQIGRYFNRDHTSVLYALRAVEAAPHLYPIGDVETCAKLDTSHTDYTPAALEYEGISA